MSKTELSNSEKRDQFPQGYLDSSFDFITRNNVLPSGASQLGSISESIRSYLPGSTKSTGTDGYNQENNVLSISSSTALGALGHSEANESYFDKIEESLKTPVDLRSHNTSTYSIQRRTSTYIKEGEYATFRISRSGNTSSAGSVRFYALNGTATSGSDFTAANSVITFSAGQTYRDISVKALTDSIKESDEYFWGRISTVNSADKTSKYQDYQFIQDSSVRSDTTLSLKLSDAALKEYVNTALSDSVFTKDELSRILSIASLSGVSQSEFSDLRIISDNISGYLSSATKDYYSYIFKSVVLGNNANKYYTGGTSNKVSLGDLQAGSSEAHLKRLISKWFAGSDRPSNSVGGDSAAGYGSMTYSYANMTGKLIEDGVSYADVAQGRAGTCYLLAAASAAAKTNTDLIKSMFHDNGDGTYGVRFYTESSSKIWVTVDTSTLVSNSSPALATNQARKLSGEMWVTLLEKAYAQANEIGQFGRKNSENSYRSIEGGLNEAIMHITGKSSSYVYAPNYSSSGWEALKSQAISKFNSGSICFVGTYKNDYDSFGRKTLVANHAFAVVGYNSTTGMFTLRNPWGTGSTHAVEFNVSWTQLFRARGVVAFT